MYTSKLLKPHFLEVWKQLVFQIEAWSSLSGLYEILLWCRGIEQIKAGRSFCLCNPRETHILPTTKKIKPHTWKTPSLLVDGLIPSPENVGAARMGSGGGLFPDFCHVQGCYHGPLVSCLNPPYLETVHHKVVFPPSEHSLRIKQNHIPEFLCE